MILRNWPLLTYRAFIEDGLRLYRLLPGALRRSFWVVMVAQFLTAFTETCTLLVISFFALSVGAPEAALDNFIFKAALNLVPPLQDFITSPRRLVGFASALMTAFIFFKALLSMLTYRRTAVFTEDVGLHIGRETLQRYLNKDYYWHLSPESQAVIHKFDQRGTLTQFLVNLLLLYSNAFCCLVLFASLFWAEPWLALTVISVFSGGSLGVYLFLRRRLDAAGRAVSLLGQAENADRLALAQGLRELFISRRQAAFFRKATANMVAGRPERAVLSFAGYLPSLILEFLGFSTISLMTIVLLFWGRPMPEIISASSMLMLTAWRILPAVNRALGYAVSLRGLRPAALICLNLLETFVAEETEHRPEPDPNFKFEKCLTLEEAEFRYPGGREAALKGLTLHLRKGERLGLIGLSGAGKSTLALLLTGLVKPQGGRFLADGRELSPAEREAYLRLVGFVPQTPMLLPGTVADNVAFSRWGEPYEREAVAEACRRAAMDFIFQDPQGLDRPLGAGGQGLSGGQAQRVTIARALFAQPEIIIFDEATSALDQAGENAIAETIRRLAPGTTVVVIAHRLTTVENCDRLVWLEDGRAKAEGSPAEILPLYKAAMQTDGRKIQTKD